MTSQIKTFVKAFLLFTTIFAFIGFAQNVQGATYYCSATLQNGANGANTCQRADTCPSVDKIKYYNGTRACYTSQTDCDTKCKTGIQYYRCPAGGSASSYKCTLTTLAYSSATDAQNAIKAVGSSAAKFDSSGNVQAYSDQSLCNQNCAKLYGCSQKLGTINAVADVAKNTMTITGTILETCGAKEISSPCIQLFGNNLSDADNTKCASSNYSQGSNYTITFTNPKIVGAKEYQYRAYKSGITPGDFKYITTPASQPPVKDWYYCSSFGNSSCKKVQCIDENDCLTKNSDVQRDDLGYKLIFRSEDSSACSNYCQNKISFCDGIQCKAVYGSYSKCTELKKTCHKNSNCSNQTCGGGGGTPSTYGHITSIKAKTVKPSISSCNMARKLKCGECEVDIEFEVECDKNSGKNCYPLDTERGWLYFNLAGPDNNFYDPKYNDYASIDANNRDSNYDTIDGFTKPFNKTVNKCLRVHVPKKDVYSAAQLLEKAWFRYVLTIGGTEQRFDALRSEFSTITASSECAPCDPVVVTKPSVKYTCGCRSKNYDAGVNFSLSGKLDKFSGQGGVAFWVFRPADVRSDELQRYIYKINPNPNIASDWEFAKVSGECKVTSPVNGTVSCNINDKQAIAEFVSVQTTPKTEYLPYMIQMVAWTTKGQPSSINSPDYIKSEMLYFPGASNCKLPEIRIDEALPQCIQNNTKIDISAKTTIISAGTNELGVPSKVKSLTWYGYKNKLLPRIELATIDGNQTTYSKILSKPEFLLSGTEYAIESYVKNELCFSSWKSTVVKKDCGPNQLKNYGYCPVPNIAKGFAESQRCILTDKKYDSENSAWKYLTDNRLILAEPDGAYRVYSEAPDKMNLCDKVCCAPKFEYKLERDCDENNEISAVRVIFTKASFRNKDAVWYYANVTPARTPNTSVSSYNNANAYKFDSAKNAYVLTIKKGDVGWNGIKGGVDKLSIQFGSKGLPGQDVDTQCIEYVDTGIVPACGQEKKTYVYCPEKPEGPTTCVRTNETFLNPGECVRKYSTEIRILRGDTDKKCFLADDPNGVTICNSKCLCKGPDGGECGINVSNVKQECLDNGYVLLKEVTGKVVDMPGSGKDYEILVKVSNINGKDRECVATPNDSGYFVCSFGDTNNDYFSSGQAIAPIAKAILYKKGDRNQIYAQGEMQVSIIECRPYLKIDTKCEKYDANTKKTDFTISAVCLKDGSLASDKVKCKEGGQLVWSPNSDQGIALFNPRKNVFNEVIGKSLVFNTDIYKFNNSQNLFAECTSNFKDCYNKSVPIQYEKGSSVINENDAEFWKVMRLPQFASDLHQCGGGDGDDKGCQQKCVTKSENNKDKFEFAGSHYCFEVNVHNGTLPFIEGREDKIKFVFHKYSTVKGKGEVLILDKGQNDCTKALARTTIKDNEFLVPKKFSNKDIPQDVKICVPIESLAVSKEVYCRNFKNLHSTLPNIKMAFDKRYIVRHPITGVTIGEFDIEADKDNAVFEDYKIDKNKIEQIVNNSQGACNCDDNKPETLSCIAKCEKKDESENGFFVSNYCIDDKKILQEEPIRKYEMPQGTQQVVISLLGDIGGARFSDDKTMYALLRPDNSLIKYADEVMVENKGGTKDRTFAKVYFSGLDIQSATPFKVWVNTPYNKSKWLEHFKNSKSGYGFAMTGVQYQQIQSGIYVNLALGPGSMNEYLKVPDILESDSGCSADGDKKKNTSAGCYYMAERSQGIPFFINMDDKGKFFVQIDKTKLPSIYDTIESAENAVYSAIETDYSFQTNKYVPGGCSCFEGAKLGAVSMFKNEKEYPGYAADKDQKHWIIFKKSFKRGRGLDNLIANKDYVVEKDWGTVWQKYKQSTDFEMPQCEGGERDNSATIAFTKSLKEKEEQKVALNPGANTDVVLGIFDANVMDQSSRIRSLDVNVLVDGKAPSDSIKFYLFDAMNRKKVIYGTKNGSRITFKPTDRQGEYWDVAAFAQCLDPLGRDKTDKGPARKCGVNEFHVRAEIPASVVSSLNGKKMQVSLVISKSKTQVSTIYVTDHVPTGGQTHVLIPTDMPIAFPRVFSVAAQDNICKKDGEFFLARIGAEKAGRKPWIGQDEKEIKCCNGSGPIKAFSHYKYGQTECVPVINPTIYELHYCSSNSCVNEENYCTNSNCPNLSNTYYTSSKCAAPKTVKGNTQECCPGGVARTNGSQTKCLVCGDNACDGKFETAQNCPIDCDPNYQEPEQKIIYESNKESVGQKAIIDVRLGLDDADQSMRVRSNDVTEGATIAHFNVESKDNSFTIKTVTLKCEQTKDIVAGIRLLYGEQKETTDDAKATFSGLSKEITLSNLDIVIPKDAKTNLTLWVSTRPVSDVDNGASMFCTFKKLAGTDGAGNEIVYESRPVTSMTTYFFLSYPTFTLDSVPPVSVTPKATGVNGYATAKIIFNIKANHGRIYIPRNVDGMTNITNFGTATSKGKWSIACTNPSGTDANYYWVDDGQTIKCSIDTIVIPGSIGGNYQVSLKHIKWQADSTNAKVITQTWPNLASTFMTAKFNMEGNNTDKDQENNSNVANAFLAPTMSQKTDTMKVVIPKDGSLTKVECNKQGEVYVTFRANKKEACNDVLKKVTDAKLKWKKLNDPTWRYVMKTANKGEFNLLNLSGLCEKEVIRDVNLGLLEDGAEYMLTLEPYSCAGNNCQQSSILSSATMLFKSVCNDPEFVVESAKEPVSISVESSNTQGTKIEGFVDSKITGNVKFVAYPQDNPSLTIDIIPDTRSGNKYTFERNNIFFDQGGFCFKTVVDGKDTSKPYCKALSTNSTQSKSPSQQTKSTTQPGKTPTQTNNLNDLLRRLQGGIIR